ncbi:hypothetical protein [Bacteroides caccae]|uniref:hypothetical protein n=1 Tax=Bacteroides caccae TaxID=47678 RepID=UPI0022AA293D|nr:hypothetical protein [Bacteroides caccae]MCZ2726294.1 hypothetical protein [Bacteroides caccae]
MWYEDKIELYIPGSNEHDENFNPVRNPENWIPLGDCKIHGNSSAKTVPAADGKDSIYNYQITMYTPVIIPALNDKVRITKADGSISQKVMTVIGCGTTKGKLSIFL